MKSTYANKVFAITDLTKYIGSFKHQMEQCMDIEKLNKIFSFQSLVYHLFHHIYDSGITVRNTIDDNRLSIRICKHKNPIIPITFEVFEKHKRIPCYYDILFLDFKDKPIDNQNKLANHILSDEILFPFFQYEKKSYCNHS